MNWDADDELKKQWEEVKKVEEKSTQKEVAGGVWEHEVIVKGSGACGFSACV